MTPHGQVIFLSLLLIIAAADASPNLRRELEARKERDDSLDYDRFLQELNDDDDDPRHGEGPNIYDAPNGGGGDFHFTHFPSGRPSAAPSPNPTTSSAPTECEDTTERVWITEKDAYRFCKWAANMPRVRCSYSNVQDVCPRSCGNCANSPSVEPSLMSSVSPSSKPSLYASNAPSTRPSTQQSGVLPSASPLLNPSVAPSPSGSALPSPSASALPSGLPSIQPSPVPSTSKQTRNPSSPPTPRMASVFPSSPPSIDPCKGDNGKYGDTSDEESLTIVTFTYGIEMDMDVMREMSASISDLTEEVEEEQLNLLVQSFSTDCNNGNEITTRSLNIFADGKMDHLKSIIIGSDNTKDETIAQRHVPDEIIGFKSDPLDLPNGSKFVHARPTMNRT